MASICMEPAGDRSTQVHILPDEIARARITLHSLLPRESASKQVDAATLPSIGFPAFAVTDEELVDRTRSIIVDRLQGNYGCKRFLRDGHQTVLEDHSRLHYEPSELKVFEHIECEWPLFFTYLLAGCPLSRARPSSPRNIAVASRDSNKDTMDIGFLPELYYVPASSIEAEKREPRQSNPSSERECSPGLGAEPLVAGPNAPGWPSGSQ